MLTRSCKCINKYRSISGIILSKIWCSIDATNVVNNEYSVIINDVDRIIGEKISKLLNQETYINDLSQQIYMKQQQTQKTLSDLKRKKNSNDESILFDGYNYNEEPGLNLTELSSESSLNTFYGSTPMYSFNEFKDDRNGEPIFSDSIISTLNDMGIVMPSHIQRISIPEIIKGNNVVIGAETGSGKTLAYSLPVIQMLLNDTTYMDVSYNKLSKIDIIRNRMIEENIDINGINIKDELRKIDKLHPFMFNAEKKYPCVIILQPNQHLCEQTAKIINEILRGHYKITQQNNRQIYAMPLFGRNLISNNNDLVPDILVTTPNALFINMDKQNNENNYFAFLSKIRYMILDEADQLVSTQLRKDIQYIFYKFKEIQQQIKLNPLKYLNLLPNSIRKEFNENPSKIYNELNKIGKPQTIFAGATIPTNGKRTVSNAIKNWLSNAVWCRTPGFHEICSHIAQEFRYIPKDMELPALHDILLNIAYHNDQKISDEEHEYENNDDNENDAYTPKYKDEMFKKHKKESSQDEMEQEKIRGESVFVLIFVNAKKNVPKVFEFLYESGWRNITYMHGTMHRNNRAESLKNFS